MSAGHALQVGVTTALLVFFAVMLLLIVVGDIVGRRGRRAARRRLDAERAAHVTTKTSGMTWSCSCGVTGLMVVSRDDVTDIQSARHIVMTGETTTDTEAAYHGASLTR